MKRSGHLGSVGFMAACLAAAPAVAQDAPAGEIMFKRCAICHSVTPGKGSTIGPNLSGVVGRKAGTQPGFVYSAALSQSAITWTPDTLDAFLTRPSALVPGNRMAFGGLPVEKDRNDLIAYLKAQSK